MGRDNWTVAGVLAVAALVGWAGQAEAHSSGARGPYTGGGFPGESACTQCHTGQALNSGSGTLELLAGGRPADGQQYVPGEVVALVVRFSDPAAVRVGFQLTARSGDGCGQPGSLAPGMPPAGSSIKLRDDPCPTGSGPVQSATHTRPRTAGSSPTEFEVAWTAPSEEAGPVVVAVAVNSADGSLNPRGDRIYTLQASLEPQAQLGPPVISGVGGGVVIGDPVSQPETAAPQGVATVWGTGFVGAGITAHGQLDPGTGRLAQVLAGTCVEVGQQRAPILHLEPSRATFQVPAGTMAGTAMVRVVQGCGTATAVASAPAGMRVAAARAALLGYGAGGAAVAAMHADTTLVAPPPAAGVAAASARPARPGDEVALFGTGLGATSPALETGEVTGRPLGLAAGVRVMVGDFEVPPEGISYQGATPYFAGLYQLNLMVPENVPPGDHAVRFVQDGLPPSNAVPLLSVSEPMARRCEVGDVVRPGESCEVVLGPRVFVFANDENGLGCLSGPLLPAPVCGDDLIARLGLFGAEARVNDDGSWTVVKLP